MVEIYQTHMQRFTAKRLLEENVRALLRRRGWTQRSLAGSIINPRTGKAFTEVWLSAILSGERGVPLEHLSAIADRLGVQIHELFVPGISETSERRSGRDRRTGRERRLAPPTRQAIALDAAIAATHPRRTKEPFTMSPSERALIEEARHLSPAEFEGLLTMVGASRKKDKRKA